MKSKFTFSAYLIPIIVIVFLTFGITIIINKWPINFNEIKLVGYLIILSFIFPMILFIFGELRQKFIRIVIDRNTISKQNFLGNTKYDFSDFDGFQTSLITTKNGVFEYLYLVKENKKIIKISEQYHKNYFDLKSMIAGKTTFLGEIKFKYWDEIAEMFK